MTAEVWVLVWMGVLQFVMMMLHGSQIALGTGIKWGIGRRDTPPPASEIGRRIDRTLHNTLESLSVYVPIVVGLHIADLSSPMTQTAAIVYLVARLAFAMIYLAGLPVVRTLVWFIGNGAMAVMAWPLLAVAIAG